MNGRATAALIRLSRPIERRRVNGAAELVNFKLGNGFHLFLTGNLSNIYVLSLRSARITERVGTSNSGNIRSGNKLPKGSDICAGYCSSRCH